MQLDQVRFLLRRELGLLAAQAPLRLGHLHALARARADQVGFVMRCGWLCRVWFSCPVARWVLIASGAAYSQAVQEREKRVGRPIAGRLRVRRGSSSEGSFLEHEVGVEVDLGRAGVFVPEPEGDDGRVDAGV